MADASPKKTRFIKAMVVIYVAYLVTVFAVYFAVSNRDIQVSAFVQSASQWDRGHENALRAIFLNAPTGRKFNDGVVKMTFEGQTTRPPIPSHGHVHVVFKPQTPPGLGQPLVVDFTAPGEEPFFVESHIEVVDPATYVPKFTKRRVEPESKKKLVPSWEGDIKVGVLPTGGELARGLENAIYLITYDATTHLPVRSTINVIKVEGLMEGELESQYETDNAGMVSLRLKPNTTIRLTLEVVEEGTERSATGTINIFTVPSQFKIIPTELIIPPGGFVEGSVQSLHRSGALFVDVYEQGKWRVADGFGVRRDNTGFRTQIPNDVDAAFVRVQVYQNFFKSGRAWDVVHYAVGERGRCRESLARVAGEVAKTKSEHAKWAAQFPQSPAVASSTSERNCRRWLQAMLLAIPTEFTAVPVLINSQERDREALEAWRKGVQSDLKIATGVALFAGLFVILLVVLQGVARAREQERLFQEVDAELEDGEALGVGGAERYLVLMRVAILFVTLVLFAAAVMMLLNFL